MHPILVEDQQYKAIQTRLAKVATSRRDFAAQQRMAGDDYARRAGDAALAGKDLPPPPPDISAEVLGRLDREETALRAQLQRMLAERAGELEAALHARQSELLAEVRNRLLPEFRAVAEELSALGRTANQLARAAAPGAFYLAPSAVLTVPELAKLAESGADYFEPRTQPVLEGRPAALTGSPR